MSTSTAAAICITPYIWLISLIVSEDVKSNIESTNIKAAGGVTLDENQRTLVGSVLDVGLHGLWPGSSG